jgi:hypothetical protein
MMPGVDMVEGKMSVWLEHGKASWDFRGQGKNGGGVVPAYSRKNCAPVIR